MSTRNIEHEFYEDFGRSSISTFRPKLVALIADVRVGKVAQVVVVMESVLSEAPTLRKELEQIFKENYVKLVVLDKPFAENMCKKDSCGNP